MVTPDGILLTGNVLGDFYPTVAHRWDQNNPAPSQLREITNEDPGRGKLPWGEGLSRAFIIDFRRFTSICQQTHQRQRSVKRTPH